MTDGNKSGNGVWPFIILCACILFAAAGVYLVYMLAQQQ